MSHGKLRPDQSFRKHKKQRNKGFQFSYATLDLVTGDFIIHPLDGNKAVERGNVNDQSPSKYVFIQGKASPKI